MERLGGGLFQTSRKVIHSDQEAFLTKLLGKQKSTYDEDVHGAVDEDDLAKLIYIATADDSGYVKVWSCFPQANREIVASNIYCESSKRCHLSNITSMSLRLAPPVERLVWKPGERRGEVDAGIRFGKYPSVGHVIPDSWAARMGISAGDRIVSINEREVKTISDEETAAEDFKQILKKEVVLGIKRGPQIHRRHGTRVPDHTCILTSSWDRFATLWWPSLDHNEAKTLPDSNRHVNPPQGKLNPGGIDKTRHKGAINSACWRPGKDEILTCSDDCRIILWDARWNPLLDPPQIGKLKQVFHDAGEGHNEAVSGANFDSSGKTVLSCSQDTTIMLWDVKAGYSLTKYTGHKFAVWSAHFDRNDARVLSASQDGTACVWQQRRSPIHTTKHRGPVYGAIWTPIGDDIYISYGADCAILINDIRQGDPAASLKDHSAAVWNVKFGNTSEHTICTVSHDMTSLVYDIRKVGAGDVVPRCLLAGHTGVLWNACFSPDDRYVLTASEDSTARIWNIHSGEKRPEGHLLIDPVSPHQQCISFAEFINPEALVKESRSAFDAAMSMDIQGLTSLGTVDVDHRPTTMTI